MWAEYEANMDERWQIDGPNDCRTVSKAIMRAGEGRINALGRFEIWY